MLHPEAFVTKHAHCIFGAAFLASVLFVTAKFCQTKCAISFFSGWSKFALLMSSLLIMWKKNEITSKINQYRIQNQSLGMHISRFKPVHPDSKICAIPTTLHRIWQIQLLGNMWSNLLLASIRRFWATRSLSTSAPWPTLARTASLPVVCGQHCSPLSSLTYTYGALRLSSELLCWHCCYWNFSGHCVSRV